MEFFLFFSGIAILLLAMKQMESALSKLGSNQLNRGLVNFTRTPVHAVFFGLGATTLLQSSSIVGLMTMAFVGAGVIPFRNAIGVILGSNLGTTVTGWLVTFLGFKLNLTELSMPILGLGAVGIVFLKQASQPKRAASFVFAFGLLLLGLALMKDSIGFVVDHVDIESLQNLSVFTYFGFGAVLTAIIQSSSATMIITLSAMNANLINLHDAAALVIGADLGTVSTVIIGAIGATAVKKQVALVHFLFNLVTDCLALLSLPLLIYLVTKIFVISDPLYGLVAVHSSFNLVGLLLFIPFVDVLRRFVEGRFPERDFLNLYVNKVPQEVTEAALEAVEKDTCQLLLSVLTLNARRLNINLSKHLYKSDSLEEELDTKIDTVYSSLKIRENILSDYIMGMQRQPQSLESSNRLQQYLVSIRDGLYASKAIKDIQHDMRDFGLHANAELKQLRQQLLHSIESFYEQMIGSLTSSESFSPKILAEMLAAAEQEHAANNVMIYELIDQALLKKESASTALNINREILFSAHSLINALEQLKLPGEQAKTVSEMLNLKVT